MMQMVISDGVGRILRVVIASETQLHQQLGDGEIGTVVPLDIPQIQLDETKYLVDLDTRTILSHGEEPEILTQGMTLDNAIQLVEDQRKLKTQTQRQPIAVLSRTETLL